MATALWNGPFFPVDFDLYKALKIQELFLFSMGVIELLTRLGHHSTAKIKPVQLDRLLHIVCQRSPWSQEIPDQLVRIIWPLWGDFRWR
ncbi:MAG: hypothetical protein D6160_18985 [Ketobacter sp.]|nr:MAG: hypothetical protein D6160_18985 [Ketobacter sp.]